MIDNLADGEEKRICRKAANELIDLLATDEVLSPEEIYEAMYQKSVSPGQNPKFYYMVEMVDRLLKTQAAKCKAQEI